MDRWARAALASRLRRIERGAIVLVDGAGREQFGASEATLRATVYVRSPRFYRSIALRGVLGAAESYMRGEWVSDDLTTLVRIMARSGVALASLERGAARLLCLGDRILHTLRRNTRRGSRRNIEAHYDLGNDFYELFLDPTLTYSCGIFERPDATMEDASIAKYERICRKLRLRPSDRVLEIGSGWGGFALHAARLYGCRVTTTTISREQYERARERVSDADLGDRVEVLFEDYRDLTETYDKLVSIEMIEAVGAQHLDTFFRVCNDRLELNGAMLLQAITVRDRDFETSKRNVDFIKRYIFPGGQLVSLGAVGAAAARAGELGIVHVEDITPHYACTLGRWRARMLENLDRMRELSVSAEFLRIWEFYLCYCEGGFHERGIGAVQVLLDKPRTRLEPVMERLDAAAGVEERSCVLRRS
jgi:cyclopropane-fatty-acyl-phospholipid synthase